MRSEAIILPQGIPSGEEGYWYHATFGRYLRSICRLGLLVGDGRNWRDHNLRQSSVGRVWFAASPGQAHAFANQRQHRVVKTIATPELVWIDWVDRRYLGPSLRDRCLRILRDPVRKLLTGVQPRFETAILLAALWTGGICIIRVPEKEFGGKEAVRQDDEHFETVAIRAGLAPHELEVWDGQTRGWRRVKGARRSNRRLLDVAGHTSI